MVRNSLPPDDMVVSFQGIRQIFPLYVAASDVVSHLEQQLCSKVEELVAVPSLLLLTFEVDAVLEAWSQSRRDGFRLIVPAVHGHDAF